MPLELTTGVPGAGKTLFTVAEVLKPLVGQTIEHRGLQVPRRLMIGGIPDLLLPHEPVDMPIVDPETWADDWGGVERKPGDAPVMFARKEGGKLVRVEGDALPSDVPVPISGDTWWLWCMPGDVIVLDECQRLFRPMSAGKKIPQFIAKLETHRHYGVDFVLITQHPQLLHSNVRRLIGRHRHVRRLFGRASTVVYEWDQCTDPGRIKNAVKKMWMHKKSAFNLYKSAEVHTKQNHSFGAVMWILAISILTVPVLLWYTYQRNIASKSLVVPSPSASASAPTGPGPGAAALRAGSAGAVALMAWPVLNAGPAQANREPYHDRGLHLEGCMTVRGAVNCFFASTVSGKRMRSITSADLLAAGYVIKHLAPCSVVLIFGDRERDVTCDAPAIQAREVVAAAPVSPASAPL